MGHGTADPVVPLKLGSQAADSLRSLAYPVEWQQYPMQHAVCPEEIEHIAGWLQKRF